MIVAFTGIRDIASESEHALDEAVWRVASDPATAEMRFGGARGSDTMALLAACVSDSQALRRVIIPGRLANQPRETRMTTRECAHDVVELWPDRPPRRDRLLARNHALVEGAPRHGVHGAADLVVAFWDGARGGTSYTIDLARRQGVAVEIVGVEREPAATRTNPLPAVERRIAPGDVEYYAFSDLDLVALDSYRPATKGLVYAIKMGRALPRDLRNSARRVVSALAAEGIEDALVVPVPRRRPGEEAGMAAVAAWAETLSGERYRPSSVLERVELPSGGEQWLRRTRFSADEHARTMRYVGPRGASVVLIDDVATTVSTLDGATRAVERDGGRVLLRVVLTAAGDLGRAIDRLP